MTMSIVRLLASIALALALMFYPYLPGPYDAAAAALSAATQVAALVALVLLTPIGLLWLWHEFRRHSAARRGLTRSDRTRAFTLAAIVAGGLSSAAAAAIAIEHSGFALGAILLALWFALAVRSLRAGPASRDPRIPAAALQMVIVPAAVVGARFAFLHHAADWSMKRTIAASEEYIQGIEAYRQIHGRYPESLNSLNVDYPARTVSVDRFRYEPAGDTYNVWFSRLSTRLDTHEIVMYNPRDQQQATSHEADILEFSLERLNQTRGYYAVRDAGPPHWKIFLFD